MAKKHSPAPAGFVLELSLEEAVWLSIFLNSVPISGTKEYIKRFAAFSDRVDALLPEPVRKAIEAERAKAAPKMSLPGLGPETAS